MQRKTDPVALLIVSGCDQRSVGEKNILRVASLLDYSDRLLVQLIGGKFA
jgi:hypothetical protein